MAASTQPVGARNREQERLPLVPRRVARYLLLVVPRRPRSRATFIPEDLQMGILLFIVFGLVVGFLARAIMPGTQSMGLIATALLGVAGSFVGGFLVALVTQNRVTDLNTAGVIGSIVGALLLLFLVGRFGGRRAIV